MSYLLSTMLFTVVSVCMNLIDGGYHCRKVLSVQSMVDEPNI